MKPELPQPFSIDNIQKHPKAVVISLLIGLLLITCSVIGFLFIRKENYQEDCEIEKQALVNQILDERNDRIKLYESMIFYKSKTNSLESEMVVKDSIIRDKTEGFVKKILK
ncbi:hypothetical protein [Chishuiella changwenlii]|uniref:hypothetical protein n=1 Tax=Chishuiella changwenlii TaxID=1434701 RepID=UPI002FDB1E93